MNEKASVKLSTKTWHYKLIKFILGNIAPTPQNMHNLCPYFWLLVFSILVIPVVGPLKLLFIGLVKTGDSFANLMDKLIVLPSAQKWEENLTDLDIFQILQWDKDLQKFYKMAYIEDESYHAKENFAYNWWRKKYNAKVFTKESKDQVCGTYSNKFQDWMNKMWIEYENLQNEVREKDLEREKRKNEYDENLKKFRNGVDNVGNKIKDTVLSWKSIIKWTKRVMGLIVTGALLVATYFVVNFMGRGVLWLIDNWNWAVVIWVVVSAVFAGVFILIIYLMGLWIKYIDNKGAKHLWYTKIIYYLFKAIFVLAKWIFYDFLWKWIIINICHLIKRGAQLIWASFLGFLGIFGEYFGASYSDYCPGIDWEENND